MCRQARQSAAGAASVRAVSQWPGGGGRGLDRGGTAAGYSGRWGLRGEDDGRLQCGGGPQGKGDGGQGSSGGRGVGMRAEESATTGAGVGPQAPGGGAGALCRARAAARGGGRVHAHRVGTTHVVHQWASPERSKKWQSDVEPQKNTQPLTIHVATVFPGPPCVYACSAQEPMAPISQLLSHMYGRWRIGATHGPCVRRGTPRD